MTQTHEFRLAVAALAAAALVTAAGCDNTRLGDPPSVPSADELGTGERISSVLGGFFGPAPWVELQNNSSDSCYDPPNMTVRTTGVTVTAVDTWDETGDGAVGTVYVEDTVSPLPLFAGMSIFDPTFSPPDLKVLPGNVLDLAGVYEEYIGPSTFAVGRFSQCETLPQLTGAATFRFDGKVPAPVVITPDDLNSYANARQYLGMLVTVKGVSIQPASPPSSGRYNAVVNVTDGIPWTISNELWDLYDLMPLNVATTFTSVTGIVTFFGTFNVAPRSAADFVE